MARLLLASGKGKPSQVPMRCAVSTTYRALFHAMARNCADMMIGASKKSRRNQHWADVYRLLDPVTAESACKDKKIIKKFPTRIVDFAIDFAEMLDKHRTSFGDPTVKFHKSSVKADIDRSERVMKRFAGAATRDKRAFASWLLFRNTTTTTTRLERPAARRPGRH